MSELLLLAFGIVFWLIVYPKFDAFTMVFFIVSTLVAKDFVKPSLEGKETLSFTAKLFCNFFIALWQSFKMLFGGYSFASRIQTVKVEENSWKIFEKTLIITLTPYTVVIDFRKDTLTVHELIKEEK